MMNKMNAPSSSMQEDSIKANNSTESAHLLESGHSSIVNHGSIPIVHRPILEEEINYYKNILSKQEAFWKNLRQSFICVFFVVGIVFFVVGGGGIHKNRNGHHHHSHTQPTLLSVRNHLDGTFFDSLNYPLYGLFKNAEIVNKSYISEGAVTVAGSKRARIGKAKPVVIKTNKREIAFHEELIVSWDGLSGNAEPTAHGSNIIALYCPANETDQRKIRDAATVLDAIGMTLEEYSNKNILTLGSSIINEWSIFSFPVIREDTCEFRLFHSNTCHSHSESDSSCTEKLSLEATTGPFSITNGFKKPTSIHLAFTSNSDEMLVHFTTGSSGTPIVQFGEKEDTLSNEAEGTTITYQASEMCQAPANITEAGKFISPGMLHAVIMNNLKSDTEYFYKVAIDDGTDGNMIWSKIHSFRSPLAVGSTEPFSYLVYADQGCPGYGWKNGGERTSRWSRYEVEINRIRAVHHFGDLSYAQGAAHQWDAWLEMISEFSTRVPLMVGVGNHEYDHTSGGLGKDLSGVNNASGFMPVWGDFRDDSNGECGVPVAKRFIMPTNGNGVFWYSHDHASVHTVMISSEHALSPGSPQYQWLENDLKSVNRTITPWLILESHRPMYNSENVPKNTLVGISMRKEFENLLYDYNVDIYLAGHYHSYLRTCSGLYRNLCNNGGPIHITVGTAGADLDDDSLYDTEWTEYFAQEWGYGRITVHNQSALQWEFVSDYDHKVKDEIWIAKS